MRVAIANQVTTRKKKPYDKAQSTMFFLKVEPKISLLCLQKGLKPVSPALLCLPPVVLALLHMPFLRPSTRQLGVPVTG